MTFMIKTLGTAALLAVVAVSAHAGKDDGTGSVTGTTPIVVVVPGSDSGGLSTPSAIVDIGNSVAANVEAGALPGEVAQGAMVNVIQASFPAGVPTITVTQSEARAIVRVINAIETDLGSAGLDSSLRALRDGLSAQL